MEANLGSYIPSFILLFYLKGIKSRSNRKIVPEARNVDVYFSLPHFRLWLTVSSGLPKVIFLAEGKAEGEGGKTLAFEVEAEGEAEGLVFCI